MHKALLLDIEGTTTPISFVYNVLFPFAREHLHEFLSTAPTQDIAILKAEYDCDVYPNKPRWDPEGYLHWLMDQDRKSTALKAIQGKIWQRGFESGQLKGEMFPDVPGALKRWTQEGKKVFIFSSGSVLAQQLIFKYSNYGDLTNYLRGFFDTETGPKRQAESYKKIAQQMAEDPKAILFLSDVPEELAAAKEAAMQTALVIRPGNKLVSGFDGETLESFAEV